MTKELLDFFKSHERKRIKMRLLHIAVILFFLCGCNQPLCIEMDNVCSVTYTDGSKEDIICRYADLDKPAFRPVSDGEIIVTFHDLSKRHIPMRHVKEWKFKWGDKDHFGRYEKLPNGKWIKKGKTIKSE